MRRLHFVEFRDRRSVRMDSLTSRSAPVVLSGCQSAWSSRNACGGFGGPDLSRLRAPSCPQIGRESNLGAHTITKLAKTYDKLDGRTRGARAIKGVINSWKAAKEASENLDFLGAAKDILQGGKELISRYLPIPAPTQRYPTLEPPPLPTPSP